MIFNSLSFAIFLPIVVALYWILPHRFRWFLLLFASYYFYMSWNPKYIVLILFTTIVSYCAARQIEGKSNKKYKKTILAIATILCLGVLFFFKYFSFVGQTVSDVMSYFSIKVNPITLNLILPVGISFYTFQTLSYVIDVYRGDIEAEHHFGKYATFISFFPQLVAGPIERSTNLLPQIKTEHKFDYGLATYGLKQMAWGYFKKIVIADTISKYVGSVFDYPQNYHGFSLVLAVGLFSIQIYCDFSGYSDIAIGTAKLMGIKLMTNFNSPYFSQSIKEFWSRWHISLSTWFRDYIYIPLGGNRVGIVRHWLNLLVTFLISGLWHGANWTFVVWGGVHGIAQVLENAFIPKKYMVSKGIKWAFRTLIVFCFCAFTWTFFASQTLSDSFYILKNMWSGITHPISYLHDGFSFSGIGLGMRDLFFLIISLLILTVYDYVSLKKDVIKIISSKKPIFRWIIYVVFVLWLIFNIPVTDSSEFIYFQF